MRLPRTVRAKTLAALAGTFAALGLACYAVLVAVLLPRFDAYEAQTVRSDVERARAALADEVRALERRAYDWAVWDDTYRFVADGNPAYVASNLVDSVFPATDLDVLAFVALDGRLAWGRRYDPRRQAGGPLTGDLGRWVLAGPLLHGARATAMRSGLAATPEGPMLLVSAPILTSDEKGPARGTLLMGRLYGEARVRKLGELTRLPLRLAPPDAPDLPPTVRSAAARIAAGGAPRAFPVSEDVIEGYGAVPDLLGGRGIVLWVTQQRHVHRQGLAAARFLMASVSAVLVVGALVLWRLLERLVVAPLTELGAEVARVGAAQDPEARVGRGGEDEVAALSREIDRMLEALAASQREVRRAQEAALREDRLRAMGQLASGVAHDVNNGLVPVLALADMLFRDERLPEAARKRLWTIVRAAEGIAATVARLRRFYRARPEDAAPAPVDLNAVTREAVELTRPRWRDAPQQEGVVVDVQLDLDEGVLPVLGSEDELREALANLLINAADALPAGGRVGVKTCRSVSVGGRPLASVEVSDDGVGMDEETRRRCLDPFFTTKGDRGTGLGLSTVYGVVARAGGQIEIESGVGVGTTFRLAFPQAEAELPGPASARRQEAAPTAPLRLLCADDEAVVRETVRELLEAQGHRVETAGGGAEAIAAFRRALEVGEPFDAVVTDLGMPHVDGRQVAAAVKAASPATPVVLLTGWGVFLDGGPEPHLDVVASKPPTLRSLQDALARAAQSLTSRAS